MHVNRITAAAFQNAPEVGRAQEAVPLYTPQQRARRDASRWTLVQGVLAPVQFLACLISIALITRFFVSHEGLNAAHWSVWVKTTLLLTIMITGAIWEKEVFGQYLFAKSFFWEDVVSMLVIGVHLFYAWSATQSNWPDSQILSIALLAYGLYLVNAAQFIYKLRQARLSAPDRQAIEREGQL
jgi:3-vinyl bacteriochlorophyllide hydratase